MDPVRRVVFDSIQLSGEGLLQQQLFQALRQPILSGVWPAHALLPSSRQLATELKLSRNTVNLALQQLVAEGYIAGIAGVGYQVMATSPDGYFQAHQQAEFTSELSAEQQTISLHHYGLSAKTGLMQADLQPGVPDLSAFPYALWQKLTQRHVSRKVLAGMAEPQGYLPLRQALVGYLQQSRQVVCDADSILITPGAQAALYLLTRLLCQPGDKVVMEEPGYPRLHQALQLAQVQTLYLDSDSEQGLNTADLHRLPATVNALFVTPAHQYPLGGIMPLASRLELLQWAQKNGCAIIEDDYDSEFQFKHRPLASLQGLAKGEGVFYLGSFSKTLFPALRLGYLVLPKRYMAAASALLQAIYGDVAQLPQAVTADFIAEGHFSRHLRKMRLLYQQKQQHCYQLVQQYLPQARIHARFAGLHLSLEFDLPCDDQAICLQMQQYGFKPQPLSRYVFAGPARYGLVLGFANTSTERLEAGVRLIAKLVQDYRF